MNWIWLLSAVMLGVWMFTRRSFSRYVLYPAVGCVCAFVMSLIPVHVLVQLAVFVLTGLMTFIVASWPKKEVKEEPHPAQPLFGKPGYVTKEIPAKGTGEVEVFNTPWKAADINRKGIRVKDPVRVVSAKGDTLLVESLISGAEETKASEEKKENPEKKERKRRRRREV